MVCLRAAGVLVQASQFPPELDLDTIASLRLPLLSLRYEFCVAQAAAAEPAEQAAEVLSALGSLRHGRWWPSLDEIIETARRFYPGSLTDSQAVIRL